MTYTNEAIIAMTAERGAALNVWLAEKRAFHQQPSPEQQRRVDDCWLLYTRSGGSVAQAMVAWNAWRDAQGGVKMDMSGPK